MAENRPCGPNQPSFSVVVLYIPLFSALRKRWAGTTVVKNNDYCQLVTTGGRGWTVTPTLNQNICVTFKVSSLQHSSPLHWRTVRLDKAAAMRGSVRSTVYNPIIPIPLQPQKTNVCLGFPWVAQTMTL